MSSVGIARSIDPVTPPSTVNSTFVQKFPGAGKIRWERYPRETKEFLADFVYQDTRTRAFFDKHGNLLETEREISTKEIPERVLLSIRTQYPQERLIKAYEIEKNGKVILYEVILKTEDAKTSLVISTDGYFTSR